VQFSIQNAATMDGLCLGNLQHYPAILAKFFKTHYLKCKGKEDEKKVGKGVNTDTPA